MSRFFWANLLYVFDEAGEDPFGHSPYHPGLEYIRPDFPALALNIHAHPLVSSRPKKLFQTNPTRSCNFGIENQGGTDRDRQQKRAYGDRRQSGRSRHDIGQGSEQGLTGEGDTDFLARFSECCGE